MRKERRRRITAAIAAVAQHEIDSTRDRAATEKENSDDGEDDEVEVDPLDKYYDVRFDKFDRLYDNDDAQGAPDLNKADPFWGEDDDEVDWYIHTNFRQPDYPENVRNSMVRFRMVGLEDEDGEGSYYDAWRNHDEVSHSQGYSSSAEGEADMSTGRRPIWRTAQDVKGFVSQIVTAEEERKQFKQRQMWWDIQGFDCGGDIEGFDFDCDLGFLDHNSDLPAATRPQDLTPGMHKPVKFSLPSSRQEYIEIVKNVAALVDSDKLEPSAKEEGERHLEELKDFRENFLIHLEQKKRYGYGGMTSVQVDNAQKFVKKYSTMELIGER
eukprot:CAMPEP_0169205384 /NCGR_PEP_ID=MMETSP1016-20121227/12488_1 /TAXON_ID=342587 /ORGANISM="Karlodinium micrum, Strain CCMP2283" /LENGTH=324 /DNA_ID=CAMNT_0009282525 /DNA_START=47 /DNA_END=1021 /DNA_ORIENTATION=-